MLLSVVQSGGPAGYLWWASDPLLLRASLCVSVTPGTQHI